MFKRITLLAILLALFAGQAMAAPAVRVVAADTAGCDSTTRSIKVLLRLPVSAPDSACISWQLYASASTTPPTTWVDSSTAINKTSDTSAFVTGFYNGTTVYFQAKCIYRDTTTGSRTTHVYWTPVTTGYTKNIGQTLTEHTSSTSYRNFLVINTYYGADSAFKKSYMQYRIKGVTAWTTPIADSINANRAVGRDSTALGSPDSIWALNSGTSSTFYQYAPDLEPGRTYEVRVVSTDSTSSDTSNTLEITTSTLPGKPADYGLKEGEVFPGVWHFTHRYNKLNDTWDSPHILLNQGYKKIVFEVQKFGFDNNHPADSSKLYLMQVNHVNDVGYSKLDSALFNGLSGGLATAATGVMALPDTASGRKIYVMSVSEVRTVARAANDTTFINAYNPELYFSHAVKDSAGNFGASLDTTTIDNIYYDIWGYGIK
jgi:hypothetical protein